MIQKTEEITWSEEESAAAESFMEDAYRLLCRTLRHTGVHVWRGQQKCDFKSVLKDTIIVSQTNAEWGEIRPKDGYLLWIQQKFSAEFEVRIGREVLSSYTPFVGGWSPIEKVENWANKLANLDLAIRGSYLADHLKQQVESICPAAYVHTEVSQSGDQTLYRCDICTTLVDHDWFCAALVLNEEGKVGLWTREHFEGALQFDELDFEYDFSDIKSVGWIEEILLSDVVLEELTL